MGFPFPIPYDPNQPIPNNPFYFPETYYVQGPLGPLVIGAGLNINYSTGTLTSTGGGGVTDINAGFGINVSATTGSVLVTNTGVLSLTAGAGINLTGSTGNITISATGGGGGSGTVTSITAGTGLTGGTITTSGTIALANTAVTPGPYTYASFTVDSQGRITAASNGATPVIVNDFNAKGDLLVGTGNDTFTALGVGTNDYLLTADSACSSGMKWAPNAAMPVTGGIFTGDVTFYGGVQGGAITSIGSFTPGDGYASNLSWVGAITGGTGSGATGSATSDGSGNIVSFTITNGGLGYTVGDTISISAFTFGNPVTAIVSAVTPTIPGAGIIDCAGSHGTVGQVLTATSFNTVQWCSSGAVPATPTVEGVLYGCSTAGNVSVGKYALTSLTTGTSNTALGCEALYSITDGCDNVAIGLGALILSASGCYNTAVGTNAMYFTGNGVYNVAVGQRALYSNDTGNYNTALGDLAGFNSNGSVNVFVGEQAGYDFVNGDSNTFLGPFSAFSQTGGSCNVAIGTGAALPNLTGSCQLAIGRGAGNWLTGCSDFAIQPGAGILDCAGSAGTAGQVLSSNGANAIEWIAAGGGSSATPTVEGIVYGCTFGSNAALGENALLGNTGNCNTAVGCNALCNANSGKENTAVGHTALRNNQTGQSNTAVGQKALLFNDSGANNVAVGVNALFSNSTGGWNTGVGLNALYYSDTGCYNTSVGWQSGIGSDTGCYNTSVGTCTLANISGCSGNTAVGSDSLAAISGNYNTAIGYCAGQTQTSGDCNVIIGCGATLPVLTGSCQLAIGFSPTDNWLTGCSTKAIQPGAGIIDCSASCGTANMVLTSQGNAIEWKSVNSALAAPNYGSFVAIASQTLTTVNVPQPITFDLVPSATNFSLSGGPGGSQIVVAEAGIYNFQFSAQLISIAGGGGIVEIWPVKNTVFIPDTNTQFTIKNVNEAEFAALNYVLTLAAGDTLELYWATDNANIALAGLSSAFGGPDIPAVIATIVPVGA